MSQVPRENLDRTKDFLSEGYTFISNRCRRFGSDIFQTRLMGQKVTCFLGAEAASEFYHPNRFTRKGALPQTVLRLLQDKGSVQLLDGEQHRHRKKMFVDILTQTQAKALAEISGGIWKERISQWKDLPEVVLLTEAQEVFCRSVCQWAGVPLPDEDVSQRAKEFASMVDGAGSPGGPRNWRGFLLRARTERWARDLIDDARAGHNGPKDDTALHVVAWHRDPSGALLETKVAAVELINLLRPTVAVAWFAVFAAVALTENPWWRERLADSDDADLEMFVQEVRRFYPFFPLVGGRVLRDFSWRGVRFEEGDWALLDLYGTNHDRRMWKDPDTFDPRRFKDGTGSVYDLVPQGGGNAQNGHRCPGERVVIELMKTTCHMLASAVDYEVPQQSLTYDLARMPAVPGKGFLIINARPRG